MPKKQTTIKGMFVKSHISALAEERGKEGLRMLERLYGRPLKFRNLEDVPVAEEIKIIDLILDILYGDMPPQKRAFEAGRLHFRNFLRAPVAKVIYMHSKISFKQTLLRAHTIASHIFKGVEFSAENVGQRTIRMGISHSDYPLEHFQGFFQEWLSALGYLGSVTVEKTEDGAYAYLIDWHEA